MNDDKKFIKFNFEKPSFEGFNKILLFHNNKLKLEEISFLFLERPR